MKKVDDFTFGGSKLAVDLVDILRKTGTQQDFKKLSKICEQLSRDKIIFKNVGKTTHYYKLMRTYYFDHILMSNDKITSFVKSFVSTRLKEIFN